MNNGSFNGFDPNRNKGGQGGYTDQNSYPPYQSDAAYGSYQNSTTEGYRPYEGGTYSNPQNVAPASAYAGQQTAAMSLSDYSKRIFFWMGAGMLLTFAVALGLMLFLTSGSEEDMMEKFSGFIPLFIGGIVVELVLAIALGVFVTKMSYQVSLGMFILYSIVSGVTLTPIMVVAGAKDAVFAFAAAAILFIAFAIFGIVTKRDLTKIAPLLFIGLIVLMLFAIIGIFVGMSWMSIVVSLIGIAVFVGLTAYDTQKIKSNYNTFCNDETMLKKTSVNMALQLYLDFINIFIYILRIMIASRD